MSKVLDKEENVLVVKASERDKVLDQISARAARYQTWDPDTFAELKQLRNDIRDIFNKGAPISEEIMEQLYFLDNDAAQIVDKLSSDYEKVVTPDDFKKIAQIMSSKLAERTPILKDFTRFFGRLAEDYLANAKPSESDFDWSSLIKTSLRGSKKKGYILPDSISRLFGLKPGEPLSEKFLKRFEFWVPNGTLSEIIYGVDAPEHRRIGDKYFKLSLFQVKDLFELELFKANRLPKSWTTVPWVNFDGKILEQPFTQSFEERLAYKDKDGNWTNNIIKVDQKTEPTWWEAVLNKSGKINDIADMTKARTAYAVNGNHSNDATLVKNFHLWGKDNKVSTSTIHDAFFTNIADMLPAREALRKLYGKSLEKNVIEEVLNEMRSRGLPKKLYDQYMQEAIEKGLIPIPGKSKINGRVLTGDDVLTKDDILQKIPQNFFQDFGWYGVG